VLILEITKPVHPVGAWLFRLGFRDIYPAMSRIVTGNRDAQRMMTYYWESMDAATRPEGILNALSTVGFTDVKQHVVASLFNEISATKPEA
jgi:demethylmenaquinone methyltransferase/2-methoxy-6-polyprenyl-1,4-benzoquinol methylase